MDPLTAIVLISPCALVTLLMLFFVAMRYISYRERVELAQHGIFANEEPFMEKLGQRSPRGILWAGVITAMGGLALLLGLATIGIGVWLLGGLIPLFVGLGMVFIYFIGGGTREKTPQTPEQERAEEIAAMGSDEALLGLESEEQPPAQRPQEGADSSSCS